MYFKQEKIYLENDTQLKELCINRLYKCLALCTLIKANFNSSHVKDDAIYKQAKSLNLNNNTYKKILDDLILIGWVTKSKGNSYTFLKFRTILKNYCEYKNIVVKEHELINSKNKNKSIQEIVDEIKCYQVIDNEIAQQLSVIERQAKTNALLEKIKTEKNSHKRPWYSKSEYKGIKSLIKKFGSIKSALSHYNKNKGNNELSDRCFISVRLIAKKLGISIFNAWKIIKKLPQYGLHTKIQIIWVDGNSDLVVQMCQDRFPTAHVVACPYYKKTKISFGTEVSLSPLGDNSFKKFQKPNGEDFKIYSNHTHSKYTFLGSISRGKGFVNRKDYKKIA